MFFIRFTADEYHKCIIACQLCVNYMSLTSVKQLMILSQWNFRKIHAYAMNFATFPTFCPAVNSSGHPENAPLLYTKSTCRRPTGVLQCFFIQGSRKLNSDSLMRTMIIMPSCYY